VSLVEPAYAPNSCARSAGARLRQSRAMPGIVDAAANQLRVAKRLAPRRGASLAERFGPLDDRLVFVIGSPRSGTTFLAGAIGALPGFVDLGEVAPVKAAVPELAALPSAEAAARLRRILAVARRVGLVGSVRAIEQTPELAHVADALPLAFPEAVVVHIVRDGRDVVCSLLEKPWLKREQPSADDAGLSYGSYARFWVEPDRRAEFESASDARRAAWVWRSYVTAARAAANAVEVRYEELAADPDVVAEAIARRLGAPPGPLALALGRAHASSVGRYRSDLTPEQLADVEDEAGGLLRALGY
jgi:sulfotransferase family protein